VKARVTADVSRRQGPVPPPAEPNGEWTVNLKGPNDENLGYFEFDKPGTYKVRYLR